MRGAIAAATGLGLALCGGAGAQAGELDPFIALSCASWLQNASAASGGSRIPGERGRPFRMTTPILTPFSNTATARCNPIGS
jgi:hypothetical protein